MIYAIRYIYTILIKYIYNYYLIIIIYINHFQLCVVILLFFVVDVN